MTKPGLQPERTDLAWSRTALAAAGCALLLLGVAARHGLTVTTLLPAALMGITAISLALLGRRPVTSPGRLALIGALLTVTCLTSLPIAI